MKKVTAFLLSLLVLSSVWGVLVLSSGLVLSEEANDLLQYEWVYTGDDYCTKSPLCFNVITRGEIARIHCRGMETTLEKGQMLIRLDLARFKMMAVGYDEEGKLWVNPYLAAVEEFDVEGPPPTTPPAPKPSPRATPPPRAASQ